MFLSDESIDMLGRCRLAARTHEDETVRELMSWLLRHYDITVMRFDSEEQWSRARQETLRDVHKLIERWTHSHGDGP